MVEAAFTFILIISVAYGTQTYTQDYFKGETVDIRADRVERASVLLKDYPSGLMELGLTGYEFKVESSQLHIKFDQVNASRNLSYLNYSDINGPSSFEKLNNFCVEKSFENELEFKSCS